MKTTNVAQKKQFPAKNFADAGDYSDRLARAKTALDSGLKSRQNITVEHAVLYQDNARVYYLDGFHQKHCKIMLPDLQAHVLEVYYKKSDVSDVTVYYFIEEKLSTVCKSYLESGKEITAL